MNLRKWLLAGTAAVAITAAVSGTSLAADVPVAVRKAPPPEAGRLFDWSGLYVGGHLGYGRARTAGCVDCADSFDLNQSSLRLRGVLGGLQLGYNVQRGTWVYGLEGDLSFMRWRDTIWDTPSTGSSNTQARVDMLASVRGRLGVAVDRSLFFATAGVAIPRARSSLLNSGVLTPVKFRDVGAVLGGGVEWAATNQLRLRLEGLYYIFNDKKSMSHAHSGAAGDAYKLKNTFVVRAAASWYFGGP